MHRAFLFVSLLLLFPLAAHAAMSDVIIIEEFGQDGKKIEAEHVYSVDIDSLIKVSIDKRKLVKYFSPVTVSSSMDDEKLDKLKELLNLANAVKESFVPNSKLDSSQGEEYLKLAGNFFTELSTYTWDTVARKRTVLGDQLAKAFKKAEGSVAKLSDKEQVPGIVYIYIYGEMIRVLSTELDSIVLDIEGRQAMDQYEFSLLAYHSSVDGGVNNIPIPPYTTGERCAPRPVERFNLKPNAMTKKELELVNAALPLANDILSGKAKDNLKKLIEDIRAELVRVKSQLTRKELLSVLNELKQEVEQATVVEKQEVLDQINNAKALIDKINTIAALSDDPQQILSKLDEIGELFDGASGQIASFKRALESLKKLMPKVATVVSAKLKNRFESEVETVKTNLADIVKNNELVAQIQSIRSLVNGWKVIQGSAEKLVAASIPVDRVVDVEIDLQSLCSERRRGDMIKIEASIYSIDANKEKTQLDYSTRSLQLEKVGLYAEPHGYLAFVDPRKTVDTTQNYMAAPALGFYLYRGVRDCKFYNELLKPGIGISLSALDFNQNKDLEIGIAIGVVLFQDTIHIGYGRNLQAKANYIYFGLNPLAMWELSQSKSMAP